MTGGETPLLPPMRPDERGIVVLCHLSTLVPLWALVANGLLYFLYRESSRVVCFHARQGINFHILFLLCVIPLFLIHLLADLARILLGAYAAHEQVCRLMDQAANVAILVCGGVYAVFCVIGIIQALRGRIFVYPLVGRQLYERLVRTIRRGNDPEAPE